MTPERRAELRALCDAATAGPWTMDEEFFSLWSDSLLLAATESSGLTFTDDKANARFIAAARTELPTALDALDAADRTLAELRGLCGEASMRIWESCAPQIEAGDDYLRATYLKLAITAAAKDKP